MASAPVPAKLTNVPVTITGTETIIGDVIACGYYDTLTFYIDYVDGNETGVFIVPYVKHEKDGDEYPFVSWSPASGDRIPTKNRFYMEPDQQLPNVPIILDVKGVQFIILKMDANGTGPFGTLDIKYTLTAV